MKYRLAERIGGGGMGDVYRAEHVLTGRIVAIKVLHAELSDNQELAQRFFQEAQAVNRIRHPNIVDVLDAGVGEIGPYIVMEYLEGESVGTALGRMGRFEADAAVGTAIPVLEALDAAHRQGIIHRDLKPENVFIAFDASRGQATVRLLDFGIAKMLDGSEGAMPRTRTGVVFGTPDYLSPEQATGETALDGRSDLFAVGVLLYELLSGQRPFRAPTAVATAFRVVHAEVPTLVASGIHVDPKVEAVVLKLLQKEPARRFPTAGDVVRELERISPDSAKRVTALGKIIQVPRRLAMAALSAEKRGESSNRRQEAAPSVWNATGPNTSPAAGAGLGAAAPIAATTRQPQPIAPAREPIRIEEPLQSRSALRAIDPTLTSTRTEDAASAADLGARPGGWGPRGGAGIAPPAPAPRRPPLRPFPEKFAGRFRVRGPVLLSIDKAIVDQFGQRARDSLVAFLPERHSNDFKQNSLNAMVLYDLEVLDAYMELATDLIVRDLERWREIGKASVGGELFNVVRSLLRPSPDYSSLVKRGALIWKGLFSFGQWRGGSAAGGRALLQVNDFEPTASPLRQWIAGVVEETARRATGNETRVVITLGEIGFTPDLTYEIS